MHVPSLMDLFHRWIRDWGWSTEVDTSSYYRSSLVGGGFSSISQDYSRTENLPSSFGQRCLVLCLLCLYVYNVLYVYNCRHEKAIKPSCILFNDTWSCIMYLVPCIWSCMTIVFLKLQIARSDIRLHIKWAVSLMIQCYIQVWKTPTFCGALILCHT